MLIQLSKEYSQYTDGQDSIVINKATVGECLIALFDRYPRLLVFFLINDGKEASKAVMKLNDTYLIDIADSKIAVSDSDVLVLSDDVPEGEGTGAKMFGGAALIVAGALVAIYGGAFAPAGKYIIGIGISVLLGGVTEVLTDSPSLPTLDNNDSTSSTYTFSGIQNTTVSGTPISVVYGRHRVGGHIISAYVDIIGDSAYLRTQIGLCEGPLPHKFIDNIASIKINDYKFTDLPPSEKQATVRRGTKNQIAPRTQLYQPEGVVDKYTFSGNTITLNANDWYRYDTASICDSVVFEFKLTNLMTYYGHVIEELIGDEWRTLVVTDPLSLKDLPSNISSGGAGRDGNWYNSITISELAPTTHTFRVKLTYTGTASTPPTEEFASVTTKYSGKDNNDSLPEMQHFGEQVTTISMNSVILSYDADYEAHVSNPNSLIGNTYTTTSSVDSVGVILTAPVLYSNSGSSATEVSYDIYWKKEGSTYNSTNKVSDKVGPLLTKVAVEKLTKIYFPETAVYTIKIVRVTPKHTDIKYQDDLYIKDINEVVSQGFIYPQTALLGVSLKANDLISGSLPTITSEIYGVQVAVPRCINSVAGAAQYYTSNYYPDRTVRFMDNADSISNASIWSGKLTNDSSFDVTTQATCNSTSTITVASASKIISGLYVELDENELRYKVTAVSGNTITLDQAVNFSGTTTLRNAKVFWTDNPVWCLYDLLTNDRYGLNKYYKIKDENRGRMLANFYLMAQYCDEYIKDDGTSSTYDDPEAKPRFNLNLVIDESKSASDWANIICASMRATLFYSEGMLWLDIDRPKPITQIFNMSNVTNYIQTGASAKSIPNTLTVSFLNKEEDYDQYSLLLEAPEIASDLSVEEVNKTLQLYGVTNEKQARRLAAYVLRAARLALTTVSFKTGSNGLMCSVGDVVGIQHDVPQWGFGGRVKSYTTATQTLVLSDTVTFHAGYDYAVQLSHNGGVPEKCSVVSQADGTVTDTIQLVNAASLSFTPTEGDLYIVGEATNTVKPFKITSIKRDENDLVEISANEYDERIYSDSDAAGSIGVEGGPSYSLLDNLKSRSVKNVKAEATVYMDTSGNIKTGATVYFTPPVNNLSWTGAIVYYGIGGFYYQTPVNKTGLVFIPEILTEGEYTFLCASVFTNGTKQSIEEVQADTFNTPYSTVTITQIIDNTVFMQGVTGLQITGQPDTTIFITKDASFTWNRLAAVDFGLSDLTPGAPLNDDNTNSWLKEYIVEIKKADGTLLRSTTVVEEKYTYTYEQNYVDSLGSPYREFSITVTAVDRLGRLSTPVTLLVNNPVPSTAPNIAS